MKLILALLAVLITSTFALGHTPAMTGAATGKQQPLPKYATPDELKLPLPIAQRDGRTPPTGAIHCPAEYELCEGLFFSWQGYTSTITSMVVPLTTRDPDATAFIVVDSASEQSSVYTTLVGAGADMDQVEFIIRSTDSVWIRDYGPRFIFEDGQRAIVDHTYNRPRPNDNLFNDYVSTLWAEPQYQIPLTHGGGNFHLFSNGDAFMTELIVNENSGLTEQDVIDYYAEYQGVNLTITEPFPTYVDSTQHIDMWMLPVGDDKVILGAYDFDPPRRITNEVAADFVARGYTVYRTPGWTSGGTHYTYTNAVIINDLVFVPKFNDSRDAQALAVFQAAMPDHDLIQVDCSSIIQAAGAIHCIVMHVPSYPLGPIPTALVSDPNGGELLTVGEDYELRWTARDDIAVTAIDIFLSTDGGATYPYEIALGEPNDGRFTWNALALNSETCRVKIVAHDGDGNSAEDVSDADFTITPYGPQVIHSFNMDSDPGWSTQGLWAWGHPTGGGGDHGSPDPTSGYTGDDVFGYNLSGDYENSLAERHLTTAALDCTGAAGTQLSFWRWLGVEQPSYDHAYLRVSNDGSNWTTLWENTGEVSDGTWTLQEFDISAHADDQATVYLRWTMGTTDSSWQYCGWNIDDVELSAVVTPDTLPGDLDCSGAVDFDDIDPFVLALSGEGGYYAEYPECNWMNADCDENGGVDFDDIDAFVALLGG